MAQNPTQEDLYSILRTRMASQNPELAMEMGLPQMPMPQGPSHQRGVQDRLSAGSEAQGLSPPAMPQARFDAPAPMTPLAAPVAPSSSASKLAFDEGSIMEPSGPPGPTLIEIGDPIEIEYRGRLIPPRPEDLMLLRKGLDSFNYPDPRMEHLKRLDQILNEDSQAQSLQQMFRPTHIP